MSNLISSLRSAAGALSVLDRALSVTQNNVANASTPGYAKQRLAILSRPFSPEHGVSGGVYSGGLLTSRSIYAEQNVRRASESYGFYAQRETALAQLEPVFEIGPNAGLGAAFSRFFQSFSALAVSPADPAAREVVIASAESVAQTFQTTARGLADSVQFAKQGIRDVTDEINQIASAIRDLNYEQRRAGEAVRTDPAMDAAYASHLEQLSNLVDFTALEQADGTYTVLVGGEVPVVIGDQLNELTADTVGVPARIFDSDNQDISGKVQRGRLSALLDTANQLLPGYEADLNRLAREFADDVNTSLAAGLDANGQTPAVNLFTYSGAGEALSIAVTAIQPDEIAAAGAGAPGSNTNALALVALGDSAAIDGQTYTSFYAGLAARLGRDVVSARESTTRHESLMHQAQSLRDDLSGVSLDEEATYLMQFQRAYQANAQMVTTLNQLTESVLQMLR
jgi:flagellar hook-associated protein 1 FlgK